MENNLIPIEELIKLANERGVSFGRSQAKARLAYLTKLRLLPQTVRRKIAGKIQGCYPVVAIDRLKKIEEMKSAGLTFSQIKYQLDQETVVKSEDLGIERGGRSLYPLASGEIVRQSSPAPSIIYSNGLAFLIIGLFLGFLLATRNGEGLNSEQFNPAQIGEGKQVYQMSQSGQEALAPVYLIALPEQNLEKLGKVDINKLNTN